MPLRSAHCPRRPAPLASGLGLCLATVWVLAGCSAPNAAGLGATATAHANQLGSVERTGTALAQAQSATRAYAQTASALASAEVVAGIATLFPTPGDTPAPSDTPGSTQAGAAPSPTRPVPATACSGQDCNSLAEHLWLTRPIPPDPDFVNYVDRSYPYGSTQDDLRDPHHGVEFFNGAGTPIVAAASGRVVVAGEDSRTAYGPTTNFYGRLVVVELDQTYNGQTVYTLYGHMQSIQVAAGQRVQAGDALGTVGATGIAIGAHLHFEVRVGRNDYLSTRNPELWLKPLTYDGQPQGVIAGRVVDNEGQVLHDLTVVIRPLSTVAERPRTRYVLTYDEAAEDINSDDGLNENFAIGDVPPGTYSVSVSTSRFYQQTLTVEPGKVAWVSFVVNPPQPLPTTDPAEATPEPEQTPAESATPEPGTPESGTPEPGEEQPSGETETPTPAPEP